MRSRTNAPILFLLFVIAGLFSGCAYESATPRRVILLIGDGVGASYWTAAMFAEENLAVKRFRVMGLVDTRATDSKVTDSAAAASAYATGVRTYNGAIGVDAEANQVPTVLEMAEELGMATGLVATSSVTHATPASFAAHVSSRNMQFEIARQMASSGVDVLLGGGRRYFDGKERADRLDLMAEFGADAVFVQTLEELLDVDMIATGRLVGFFAHEHMPAAADRTPTLPQMTEAALAVLDRNEKGFFLMVEGSQPDWRGHDNELLEYVVAETLDFDRAIGVALEYQRRNPETLIVVVADHETGGLALVEGEVHAEPIEMAVGSVADPSRPTRADALPQESAEAMISEADAHAAAPNGERPLLAKYATGHHTAQMIPLFASGPGAERFGGIIDNHEVGRLLIDIVSQ